MGRWSRMELRQALLADFHHADGRMINYAAKNSLRMYVPDSFKFLTTTHVRNEVVRMVAAGILVQDDLFSRPNCYHHRLTAKGKTLRRQTLVKGDILVLGDKRSEFYYHDPEDNKLYRKAKQKWQDQKN